MAARSLLHDAREVFDPTVGERFYRAPVPGDVGLSRELEG